MHKTTKNIALLLALILISFSGIAQDIAQFRGSERQGIYNESGLLKTWPDNGPELILSLNNCGNGYSSPIFYDHKIFITGVKYDSLNVCTAFDLDGNQLWETSYGPGWFKSFPEARSTPTIENGVIYLASDLGRIVAMQASDGKILWSVNAHEKFKGEYHRFGIAESVLLTENAVIYTTGGKTTSVIALNKKDGSLLWQTKSYGGERSYASSVLINWKGKETIIAQTAQYLLGIDPSNGSIRWDYDLFQFHTGRIGKGNQSNNAIYSEGKIFINSGYDHPGLLFAINENNDALELLWKNDTLDTHHGGCVLIDGNIYGSNWLANSKGNWASLNWETGKVSWETPWINKGSIVSADNMLYLFEEKSGTVALVVPDPKELKIVSTFKFEGGSGPYWAHPYIADQKLFLRHGEDLKVYNLKS